MGEVILYNSVNPGGLKVTTQNIASLRVFQKEGNHLFFRPPLLQVSLKYKGQVQLAINIGMTAHPIPLTIPSHW